MAKDDLDRTTRGVLGDITPNPQAREHQPIDAEITDDEETDQSMSGGSQHDSSKHSGSRDVPVTGGAGTEVGGTRNYRQGTGATGGDIGNRPE